MFALSILAPRQLSKSQNGKQIWQKDGKPLARLVDASPRFPNRDIKTLPRTPLNTSSITHLLPFLLFLSRFNLLIPLPFHSLHSPSPSFPQPLPSLHTLLLPVFLPFSKVPSCLIHRLTPPLPRVLSRLIRFGIPLGSLLALRFLGILLGFQCVLLPWRPIMKKMLFTA